jgi:predicted nucleotidyltransferase
MNKQKLLASLPSVDEIKKAIKEHEDILKEKYKVKEISIFGSYVRGEAKKSSDIDILVELGDGIGLLTFIEIEEYLSDILGIKVDLVEKEGLKPRIGQNILREAVRV